ncbi:MAG: hypothetical protein ACREPG_07555, partial [Candidatus Binatia bacterium]
MNLYFMRHGVAVSADDPSVTHDNERRLTDKGVKRMRRARAAPPRHSVRRDLNQPGLAGAPNRRYRCR